MFWCTIPRLCYSCGFEIFKVFQRSERCGFNLYLSSKQKHTLSLVFATDVDDSWSGMFKNFTQGENRRRVYDDLAMTQTIRD